MMARLSFELIIYSMIRLQKYNHLSKLSEYDFYGPSWRQYFTFAIYFRIVMIIEIFIDLFLDCGCIIVFY